MAGNTLGKRGNYVYTSDSGTQYGITTDEDLAEAAGLEALTAGVPQLPRRFKPRIVWVEADIAGEKIRKALIVGSSEDPIYSTEASSTIEIDGTTFVVTGRRGERVSFLRVAEGDEGAGGGI